jgi:5-methylthioadenosine/S-adenosylhomocysteine deaminase
VEAEDGCGVRHVMTGGRFIFRDGRHTTIDLAKLVVQAEAARARLEALNAEWHDLYLTLEPVVASFCPAVTAQPYHLRRYLRDAPA